MEIIRRILLIVLLTIPTVKFAQSHVDVVDTEYECDDKNDSSQDQVNRTGVGRVYVYYGTGRYRPYYYHQKGYPYAPYYYRYYYYPYQHPLRYYRNES